MNSGYSPKELKFGEDGRQKLVAGIDQISKAVKSTLGPRGNTVLIESQVHTHGITVTKDGVTVARSVDLLDPVENLAVRIMKQAAEKTATEAGDGTTTAIVLTEALVKAGDSMIEPMDNRTEILREVSDLGSKLIDKLKKKALKITPRRLKDVAVISANNDKEIGKVIAATYSDVGEDGIVTVEKSDSSETYSETTYGIKIDRGFSSPLFINNQKKDECIFEDVHILVSDAEITNILQIETVLKPIINEHKKFLIIAPAQSNVVNTLAANVMKSGLSLCHITPPNFGFKQHELMQDIAVAVGATYFSEKTGDDLSLITFNDLGHASKVIVGRDSSIVVKDKNEAINVQDRVNQLWDAHKLAKKKDDKDFILSRIASLTGGIGVIYVGGRTDLEQKELYDRVDDAVCAVRSAMQEGILPGSGLTLYQLSLELQRQAKSIKSPAKKIANAILGQALLAPIQQILENAGKSFEDIYESDEYLLTQLETPSWGYDVKNEKYGDLLRLGIIDPMKVTKNALQNAISVATTLLSTNAIITLARSIDYQEKTSDPKNWKIKDIK
jgi:chaperonin GroEL|nr:chaperonin GroEL [Nanoarchaeota archaeon]|tara:strand:- start:583 stop:2253 length:1671 start_codon:yes stop_codon:yes gene_type:complete